METQVNNIPEEKTRPTFLTVICILTFIWCGISLISLLLQIKETFILSSEELISNKIEELEKVEEVMPGITDRTIDKMHELAPYKIPNWLMRFLGNVFSLMGAIMMWNLRKIGFWIYTLAELLPFLLSVSLFNGLKAMTGILSMFGSVFEGVGVIIVVLILLFDLIFIGMYAANLKHMR